MPRFNNTVSAALHYRKFNRQSLTQEDIQFIKDLNGYFIHKRAAPQSLVDLYYQERDTASPEVNAEREQQIIEGMMQLVIRMAINLRMASPSHPTVSLADLVQEGVEGLYHALRVAYDPARKVKFSTYAPFWVRSYQGQYNLKYRMVVKTPVVCYDPRSVDKDGKRIELKQATSINARKRRSRSVEQDPATLEECGVLFTKEHPAAIVANKDEVNKVQQRVRNVLAKLNDRDRHVLIKRFAYGMKRDEIRDNVPPATGRNVSSANTKTSISRERFRQIEDMAIYRFGTLYSEMYGHDLSEGEQKIFRARLSGEPITAPPVLEEDESGKLLLVSVAQPQYLIQRKEALRKKDQRRYNEKRRAEAAQKRQAAAAN